jgi:N-acetylneuraminate synthase/sialic acid synthase
MEEIMKEVRSVKIGDQIVSDTSNAYVIAEIGHNHQGSVELCEKVIDAAIEAGVSGAKLQKRTNEAIFTRAFYNSPYNSPNAYAPTYGGHREALEFNRTQIERLSNYARKKSFSLFATAFDEASADIIAEAGMPAIKIASGDITNTPLLKHAAEMGLPMLVSTGGATMMDVRRAYDAIMPLNPQLVLFQCTADYPPLPEQMNLNVVRSFRQTFPEAVIGLSDHTVDELMAVAAFTLGARVIEKHFTLDRTMKGSDHALSLDPAGMNLMVQRLHLLSQALGDGIKQRYPSEERNLKKMAKALVAAKELPAGHVLRPEDLVAKSPPNGLPPYEKENFLGRSLLTPLGVDEAITKEHVRRPQDSGAKIKGKKRLDL